MTMAYCPLCGHWAMPLNVHDAAVHQGALAHCIASGQALACHACGQPLRRTDYEGYVEWICDRRGCTDYLHLMRVEKPLPLRPAPPVVAPAPESRPGAQVRCLLCRFEVPVDEDWQMLVHFHREHPLAAPDLTHFVELRRLWA